jgi:hypothetical protein
MADKPSKTDGEIAQKMPRLSKLTDMTIHWKALEQHFLMVPLVFVFPFFLGGCIFRFLS